MALLRKKSDKKVDDQISGYPHYPDNEDIYKNSTELKNIDPEAIDKNKTSNEDNQERNRQCDNMDVFGNDLDVPGSELDDPQEEIGGEDEENNFYSLGDDDSEDLEVNPSN